MELSNQEVKLPDNQRLLKRLSFSSRHLELAVNAFMAQFGTMLVKYLFQNDPLKSFISLPQKLEECFPYSMNNLGVSSSDHRQSCYSKANMTKEFGCIEYGSQIIILKCWQIFFGVFWSCPDLLYTL